MQNLTLYLYQAYDSKRSLWVRGSWFAPTQEKARFWLQREGLQDLQLSASRKSQDSLRVHPTALALFYRQLAVLMNCGTALPLALRLVSFSEDQHLCGVARLLEHNVASGQYLSKAMSAFPMIFDTVSVGLVAAGESTGRLAATLLDIADAEESRMVLRGRVIASLAYPLALAGFTFLITGIFVFYVLPLDNSLFGQMGIKLPAANRLLLSLGQLITSRWIPLPLLLGGAAVWMFARRASNRQKAQRAIVELASLIPPIGDLIAKGRAVRLLQVLGLVLISGGTVQHAIKLMQSAFAQQPKVTKALENLRDQVLQGADFGITLDRSGLFPDLVGALLRIGYETGRLEKMSLRAMELCEEDVRLGLDTLSSLIEPILLGLAGLVAGGVVLIAAMPMLKMIQSL